MARVLYVGGEVFSTPKGQEERMGEALAEPLVLEHSLCVVYAGPVLTSRMAGMASSLLASRPNRGGDRRSKETHEKRSASMATHIVSDGIRLPETDFHVESCPSIITPWLASFFLALFFPVT
ncbi:hypothetical protein B296_00016850 [Ensete ventricosum]|uniref:Uncharacterized protein n=1 Tax=Ensete ventricosum TaxID=4639 RepID=A0A426YPK7_ENSVE|nr:hypothetical protein B296_00016850 [Ensete ventricosum]